MLAAAVIGCVGTFTLWRGGSRWKCAAPRLWIAPIFFGAATPACTCTATAHFSHICARLLPSISGRLVIG